jgi:hypothetical protein
VSLLCPVGKFRAKRSVKSLLLLSSIVILGFGSHDHICKTSAFSKRGANGEGTICISPPIMHTHQLCLTLFIEWLLNCCLSSHALWLLFPSHTGLITVSVSDGWVNVEVEVTLRPTVSRPVCPGARRPSGTRDQFFFLLELSFRQLRVYFVAPSLTRGRVCNLLYNCFWALPELSLLGWSPAELKAIFYCLIWDSPNLEGQVPVFISPRNRVAQLYPWELGSLFVASYDSQGYGGGIRTRLRLCDCSESSHFTVCI